MKGQRIGYVRVSTFDQNVDRQLDGQSLDRIFTDKASGKDINRPELDAMLAFAREGDTVVVHSMDRLARNLDDLRKLVQSLTKRGVRIERSEEHTSELQSLMRISYAVFCLKKKNHTFIQHSKPIHYTNTINT